MRRTDEECDLVGVLLDRGAPRGMHLEGCTWLRLAGSLLAVRDVMHWSIHSLEGG